MEGFAADWPYSGWSGRRAALRLSHSALLLLLGEIALTIVRDPTDGGGGGCMYARWL